MKTIPAQIVKATDLEARRMSAAENLQREDLSVIEMIEAIVEIVDAQLSEDKEYAAMGKKPGDRVKSLLGKLDSVRRSQVRGSEVSGHSKGLSRKFAGQVEKIFKKLPKSLKWRSFYRHDLPLLIDFCEEVQEASMQFLHDCPSSYFVERPSRRGKGVDTGAEEEIILYNETSPFHWHKNCSKKL